MYGAHSRSSTVVMKQLSGIPYMLDRLNILQLKYMVRARYQPTDTFLHSLTSLLPSPRTKLGLQHKLLKQPLVQQLLPPGAQIKIKNMVKKYLRQQLNTHQDESRLLRLCRDTINVDPILKIPMLKVIRSRLVRWRLGWLPGSKSKPCREKLSRFGGSGGKDNNKALGDCKLTIPFTRVFRKVAFFTMSKPFAGDEY
ncbi:hypothetical protein BC941DRAFT_457441 [Chlamydoabsidia padenii]|nr:hypothetical protein BC941DRAFT_457441 [Chlamydoabsidia padenii]